MVLVGGLIEVATSGQLASRLFADEQRNGTLGLLFSTGITASEVLSGKLSALLIIPLSRLVTLLPCLMIISLMRGATPEVCVVAFITLLILLALSLGVNLLASLIFEEHSSARTFAEIFILFLLGLAPAINFLNKYFTGMALDRNWLVFTPGYAPYLLFKFPRTNRELEYIQLCNLFTFSVALILFVASAVIVSRIWREQTVGAAPSGWRAFSAMKLWRLRRCKHLLESNPYHWLIYRDFHPIFISSVTLGVIALLWLFGLWQWSGAWLVPLNFWATLLLIGGIIRWMINYLAARQIGLDRYSGSLELLLTSPLQVGDIITGQQDSVRQYVRPLFYLVGTLHILFFILGIIFHPMTGGALLNYTIISLMIAVLGPWFNFNGHWSAFWISLNTGRPGYAMRKQLWEKGAFFWIYLQIFLQREFLATIPSGGFGETIFVAVVAGVAALCYLFYKMGWDRTYDKTVTYFRNLCILHMRPIAAEPVPEISDERLKKWDYKKPLFHLERIDEKILV
ncbi:MAG: hypothetical protein ACXW3Z_02425 [Limisphaerales bacterium]